MESNSLRNLYAAGMLLSASFIIGLSGFMILEDFTILEAFYMTVITFSTVGFNEVRPLTDAGRLFTSIYIILNFIIFAYVVTIFSRYLFEGELRQVFYNLIKGREVRSVKDHTIIVGYGRNGKRAAEELHRSDEPFVIIDISKEQCAQMPDEHARKTVEGDATHDETLMLAGVDKAKAIITALPNDAKNVFITLTARELNDKIFIVARASEEQSVSKLYRAGANKVVMPDAVGGAHMAHLISKPYVNEFMELFTGIGDVQLRLEEFSYEQLKNDRRNKSIKELDVHRTTGVTIVGFKDQDKGFTYRPGPETVINEEDVMIVLGKNEEIEKFRSLYIK